MLSIVKESTDVNGVLRKKAVSVSTPISDDDKSFSLELKDFLVSLENQYPAGQNPVGIAAPQVGISKRIFAINLPDEHKDLIEDDIFINPFYLYKSFSKQDSVGENCLSVETVNTDLIVKRSKKIKICFLTVEGERKIATITGFLANVIQHEIDHLDGILFYDKAKK